MPADFEDDADSNTVSSDDSNDGEEYHPSGRKPKAFQESDTEVIEEAPQGTPYHCALSYTLLRNLLIVSL
jgi:hypothetical protein